MEGLTEGRIVHYVIEDGRSKGEHRPAIVVRVWRNGYQDGQGVPLIQLQVFTDQTNDDFQTGTVWRTSVHYDAAATPGTWHWIERA
jgi:hypothetical protein